MSIAEEYPDRIKAFLGLAAAPDLIEQLLERSTLEQRQTLADTGFVEAQVEKYHYVFSQRLWTNLHANDLLQKDKIDITCPVHLIHGQQDNFVNWQVILKLAEKIAYGKTVVKILKIITCRTASLFTRRHNLCTICTRKPRKTKRPIKRGYLSKKRGFESLFFLF